MCCSGQEFAHRQLFEITIKLCDGNSFTHETLAVELADDTPRSVVWYDIDYAMALFRARAVGDGDDAAGDDRGRRREGKAEPRLQHAVDERPHGPLCSRVRYSWNDYFHAFVVCCEGDTEWLSPILSLSVHAAALG